MDNVREITPLGLYPPPPKKKPKPSLESFKEYMCPYKKVISMICVLFIPV